jgi:hypothetical protein
MYLPPCQTSSVPDSNDWNHSNFGQILISVMDSMEYGTYFSLMNKYSTLLNILVEQILFRIIKICLGNEKKQTIKYYTLLSVI